MKFKSLLYSVFVVFGIADTLAQEILPPVIPWKGKSEVLIVSKDNRWCTPVEKSDFKTTPSYSETVAWLDKLSEESELLEMIPIGKTAENRTLHMVIATSESSFDKNALLQSSKPLLLIQAGIHSGEIDGKDAGMMLLRDIAFGKKKSLLDGVNILFIPVLNADGHERTSHYNRVNQRGPANMGWRTNAKNLNLNRDYAKIDTEELRALIGVINTYDPDLYLDIHVTDGADYQYDITYGYSSYYSPETAKWLDGILFPSVNAHLKKNGHIPGPLIFSLNGRDFSEGMVEYAYSARFSNGYGDIRHLPTILVENHSLKPFRQRVLGTYVFLEGVITALAKEGTSLREAIKRDQSSIEPEITLTWKPSEKKESIQFQGIESKLDISAVTGSEYVVWTGKKVTQQIPYVRYTSPDKKVTRPRVFWIPSVYHDVIERLKIHGIRMETLAEQREVEISEFRFTDYSFSRQPSEGRFTVKGDYMATTKKKTFLPGAVRITTDQPLGDLAIHLLHPSSSDSFLHWGFFPGIFSRTEYIEEYAIDPLAVQMMKQDAQLKEEFEKKKQADPAFAKDPEKIYAWFYERSPYTDSAYLVYPVGVE